MQAKEKDGGEANKTHSSKEKKNGAQSETPQAEEKIDGEKSVTTSVVYSSFYICCLFSLDPADSLFWLTQPLMIATSRARACTTEGGSPGSE